MDGEIQLWWTLLRGVAVANLLLWAAAAAWLRRHPPEHRAARGALLLLAGGYAAGCAWRSFWPTFDVPRLVFVDAWWSSVAVGRSVATAAELCFVAQWALLLDEAGRAAGSRVARRLARGLLPLIVVAETCSWSSVLTTSNLGHMVEESLWALAALLVAAGLAATWPQAPGRSRRWFGVAAAAAALYALYLASADVPMYAARWLADEAAGRAALGWREGLVDVATRWTVSQRWADWRSEVVWMTLYFSVGVWFSIAAVLWPPATGFSQGRRLSNGRLPVRREVRSAARSSAP